MNTIAANLEETNENARFHPRGQENSGLKIMCTFVFMSR